MQKNYENLQHTQDFVHKNIQKTQNNYQHKKAISIKKNS